MKEKIFMEDCWKFEVMRYKFDFLVIGSGIAGLSFALNVAKHGSVAILTKSEPKETATRYAQGGIAAVMYAPDSIEKHIADTLKAGCFLNNEDVVRMTITESTDRIKDLIQLGVGFDKTDSGSYDLTKEGGHTENRVFHVKDSTGEEIQRQLLNKAILHPNIHVYQDYFALEIITQHHLKQKVTRKTKDITCYGAYAFNQFTNQVEVFLSKMTLMATGGCGTIYEVTSNPMIATGDGVAMVYRAKGLVEHMEFIQFHPTSLYVPGVRPAFLITEALRGEGAVLSTETEHDFVKQYDPRGSLAPRDVVARSIDHVLKKTGKHHVYLDCRHMGKELLQTRFPNIYAKCLTHGIDISKDLLPVVPAAHYQVGGVKVDERARTSIKNLYASGECSCTGLHGANRLASNSLLEAAVFSYRAYIDAVEAVKHEEWNTLVPDWSEDSVVFYDNPKEIEQFIYLLNSLMTNYVGIARSKERLQHALNELATIYRKTEEIYEVSKINTSLCELRNMINTSYLVIKMSIQRETSIGLHYIE
jgi:L-aspartate oxidase